MLQSRYHRAVRVARRALAEQAELDRARAPPTSTRPARSTRSASRSPRPARSRRASRRSSARSTLADERGHLQDVAAAPSNLSETLHRVGRTERGARRRARGATRSSASLPTRQLWLSLAIAQYAFDSGDWETAEARARRRSQRRRFSSGNSELNALPAPRRARARPRRARHRAARSSRGPPSSRSTRASRSTSACSARCRPSSRRARATPRRRAPRSTRRSTGSSSARTTRCAWRWSSAAGLTAEATAAQQARDLGDEAAGRGRARARRAADRARARLRRGRRAARAGVPRPRGGRLLPRGRLRPGAPLGRAAAAAWDALGRPYPAAVARWRQAEALVAAGDREAAVGPAPRRSSRAERLGAAWLAGELESLGARARLRLGATPRRDGAARGGRRGRRPVRPHAARAPGARARRRGRDEPRDRPQLFMAEKTASVHVSRILAKLDVRSRTEAAGVAHRLGLDALV